MPDRDTARLIEIATAAGYIETFVTGFAARGEAP